MHQIPYIVFGSCGFYGRKEVQDILAYLRLAHDPKSEAGDAALRRIGNIASIWFQMGGEAKTTHYLGKQFWAKVDAVARQNRCSMWEALDIGYFENYQRLAVVDLQEMVSAIRLAGPDPGAMIAKARGVGYDAYLVREQGESENPDDGGDGNDGTRFENLDELAATAAKHGNVAAFLDFITGQLSKAKKASKDDDVVHLLTMHRAKGLEWPVVWLCGVSLGLLPHHRSVDYYHPETKRHIKPQSIEEERRLCYVGVTRARDELHISSLLEYSAKPLQASPFLTEMGFKLPEEFDTAPAVPSLFEEL